MITPSHLMRTKPQGERKAIDGLRRIDVKAWVPMEDRVKRAYRHARHKRPVQVPLIKGYVVAETGKPYDAVHAVDQITGIVNVTGQPCLRDRDLISLRAMEAIAVDPSKAPIAANGKSFVVGQGVVVGDGPFKEFFAVIETIDGANATICVDMFGRPTPVTMPLEFLDPV